MSNFIKIRVVGVELFRADRHGRARTGTHTDKHITKL